MRPRTILIIVAVLLALGIGGRAFLLASGWIPGEHDDLKTAISLRIHYIGNYEPRTLVIADRAEVQEILATMEFERSQLSRSRSYRYGSPRMSGEPDTVEFVLPYGTVVPVSFVSRTELSRSDRGPVYLSARFYETICSTVSAHEGRRIDITLKPR